MIRKVLQRKDIVFNTSHVFLNKGLNAVVPLMLIPYFTKVFGVGKYGELIYIQSLLTLLMFVTDYGFSITGTRDVSMYQNDKKYVSETLSSIMVLKLILAAFCYLSLFVYLHHQNLPFDMGLLYFATFTAFVLQSFTPYWFFQGIKSNWIITLINLISKVVLVILVFLFITDGTSIISVPIVEGISYALSFILSLIIIFFHLNIKFSWPDWKLTVEQLRSGRHIFFFSVFNWMITGGAIVAVEKFLSQTDLGYFATFSRLMYFAFALVQPINMALFPYMSGKANLPVKDRLRFVRDTFRIYGLVILAFVAGAFTLSDWLFTILFDDKFTSGLDPFMPVFYLMAVWISIVMVNYFIGLQVLVAFGKDKVYSRSYLVNTLVAVAGFLVLVPSIGLMGVPFSLISGELVLFIFLYSAFLKIRKGAQVKS